MIVNIKLRTTTALENIGWSLNPVCKSPDNQNYEPYKEYNLNCGLGLGQNYTLKCHSWDGKGWGSSYLIIENQRYCEDFADGQEKTVDVTITGKFFNSFLNANYHSKNEVQDYYKQNFMKC